jgi:hypothetical protein
MKTRTIINIINLFSLLRHSILADNELSLSSNDNFRFINTGSMTSNMNIRRWFLRTLQMNKRNKKTITTESMTKFGVKIFW